MIRRASLSTLFPYTTLFRSRPVDAVGQKRGQDLRQPQRVGHALLAAPVRGVDVGLRSEEHTSELQSQSNLVCRLLLEKKNTPRLRYSIRPATAQNVTRTRLI